MCELFLFCKTLKKELYMRPLFCFSLLLVSLLSGNFTVAEPIVIAHRAGQGLWSANSIEAMREIVRLDTSNVEIDINFSKSMTAMVYHDSYVGSKNLKKPCVSSRYKYLYELENSEIKKIKCHMGEIDFKRKLSHIKQNHVLEPTEQRIFSLEEALDLVQNYIKDTGSKDYGMRLWLEIKSGNGKKDFKWTNESRKLALLNINKTLKKYSFLTEVILHSFDHKWLDNSRALGLPYQTSLVVKASVKMRTPKHLLDKVIYNNYDYEYLSPYGLKSKHFIFFKVSLLERKIIQEMKKHNIKIVAWTVNDPLEWARLREMGVYGIVTDYPELLKKWLKDFRAE